MWSRIELASRISRLNVSSPPPPPSQKAATTTITTRRQQEAEAERRILVTIRNQKKRFMEEETEEGSWWECWWGTHGGHASVCIHCFMPVHSHLHVHECNACCVRQICNKSENSLTDF